MARFDQTPALPTKAALGMIEVPDKEPQDIPNEFGDLLDRSVESSAWALQDGLLRILPHLAGGGPAS